MEALKNPDLVWREVGSHGRFSRAVHDCSAGGMEDEGRSQLSNSRGQSWRGPLLFPATCRILSRFTVLKACHFFQVALPDTHSPRRSYVLVGWGWRGLAPTPLTYPCSCSFMPPTLRLLPPSSYQPLSFIFF